MITKVTCSAVFRLETEASDVLRKVGRKEKWCRNGHLPAIELSGQVFQCQPSCFLLEGGEAESPPISDGSGCSYCYVR